MKRPQLYTGIFFLIAAAVLTLLDYVHFETTLGRIGNIHVNIYPVAFCGLLGLVLIFIAAKPMIRV